MISSGLFGGKLNIEDVDVREALEQNSFALHNGLPCGRPYIAEPQDGGAISDHPYQVALGRVFVNRLGSRAISRHGTATPGE